MLAHYDPTMFARLPLHGSTVFAPPVSGITIVQKGDDMVSRRKPFVDHRIPEGTPTWGIEVVEYAKLTERPAWTTAPAACDAFELPHTNNVLVVDATFMEVMKMDAIPKTNAVRSMFQASYELIKGTTDVHFVLKGTLTEQSRKYIRDMVASLELASCKIHVLRGVNQESIGKEIDDVLCTRLIQSMAARYRYGIFNTHGLFDRERWSGWYKGKGERTGYLMTIDKGVLKDTLSAFTIVNDCFDSATYTPYEYEASDDVFAKGQTIKLKQHALLSLDTTAAGRGVRVSVRGVSDLMRSAAA